VKWQRLKTHQCNEELRALSVGCQIQHFRDSIYNSLAQASTEGGPGQPPMVERFRAAANLADGLESTGVPFGVGINSRMNRELRRLLNEEARQSADDRKSRQKQITAEATRDLLRKIRRIRLLGDHFIRLSPYSE
jgi:hypothetical protein